MPFLVLLLTLSVYIRETFVLLVVLEFTSHSHLSLFDKEFEIDEPTTSLLFLVWGRVFLSTDEDRNRFI